MIGLPDMVKKFQDIGLAVYTQYTGVWRTDR